MTEPTIEGDAPALDGARVAVVGLGRTGQAAVRFLIERGARVTASERRLSSELGRTAEELQELGASLETGGHREETLRSADLVIASPGVPLSSPPMAAARAAGVPIWAEVELAARFLRGPLIGVTGSNGKSTVTTLIAHLLGACGIDAVACGNLGTPLITLAGEDRPGRRYVVELSSFQLEGIERLRPRIAVLTNLTADHQDRYDSFEAYVAAKARIFSNQQRGDDAVVNADDPVVANLARGAGGATRRPFSVSSRLDSGAWLEDDTLRLRVGAGCEDLLPASELPLAGRHNVENALAASLAARLAGATPEALGAGLRSFRGLPHRMELVAELQGVEYFNDSKATNVGATRRVMESLDRTLVLILGGRDKGADFSALAGLLPTRVRHLVLMGEARRSIAAQLGDVVPVIEVETLPEAVEAARVAARPGDAVLLAPACASFDAYGSFEERGDHFRALVKAMKRVPPGGKPGPPPRKRKSDG